MFCYLFVLRDRTQIALNEFEVCPKNEQCRYFKDDACQIGMIKNENLTKDKFGWMIDNWIKFEVPLESKSKSTRYVAIISLVHPSEADIWIIYSLRHNKKANEWNPLYRYHQGTDMKEFETLMAMNAYMKKIGFTGRKLTEADFLLKEKPIILD